MRCQHFRGVLSFVLCFIITSSGAQTFSAVKHGLTSYNLPGSTGLVFDTTTLPTHNWYCSGNGSSDIFVSKNFGFSLPSNAHILGISVFVDVIIHNLMDSSVVLLKSGVPYGADGAHRIPIVVAGDISWGSTTDMWGGSWTPAELNNANFGVQLRVRDIRPDSVFKWDDANPVYVTVTYDTNAISSVPENQPANTGIKIFPNPAHGIITVDITGDNIREGAAVSVRLVTIEGHTAWQDKCIMDSNGRMKINTAGVAPGFYICEVTNGNGVLRSKVVVY